MKKILLTLLFAATNAGAQTLECPARSGKNDLQDAKVFFDDKLSEIQGTFSDVKNGYDVVLPLNVKFLACHYKGDITVWREFTPKTGTQRCAMKVRSGANGKKNIKLHCE